VLAGFTLGSARAGGLEKDFREPKPPKEHYWNFSCSRDGGDGGCWLRCL